MFFIATFGKCRFVHSQEKGHMVEGPEFGIKRVLVEANDADSAKKSAQRFEHIVTDWTEGMTVVKSIEPAIPEDIGKTTPISWYEEHWPQRCK